ncbi:Hint domain-containing protein [Thioclava kandeliae]|uniref:Hint domain-containing protein n=1 Tax=Thioclava kandeliae TaxID=3070818 RepID=A0ABV1SCJ3_9RHOB
MSDINSWGWYASSLWPGASLTEQNNLDTSGNGLSVDPDSYVEVTLHDADNDGYIWDDDSDDVHRADDNDTIVIEALTLFAHEIARYSNSSITVNGVTYTGLDMEVTLYTNGTWSARLLDSSLPNGVNYQNVDSVTLGTWDGVEYDGVTISHIDDPFVCFAENSMVMTTEGPRPVETITTDDRLITHGGQAAAVVWVGCRTVVATGKAAPIRFGKGSIGNHRPLYLSPHHRVLVGHPALEELTGYCHGFVAARHLCGLHPDIRPAPRAHISYWHILTEYHEAIMAEGAWVETLYPGSQAWNMLGPACHRHIHEALPHLQDLPGSYGPLAYPDLPGKIRRQLGADLLSAGKRQRAA